MRILLMNMFIDQVFTYVCTSIISECVAVHIIILINFSS